MSDTLSSLIAFIGFLIVFSMLVQAVQEGVKNLLKLKTGVWERFFVNFYKRQFSLKSHGWARVKRYRARVWSGEIIGNFDKRLKRLKEIVTTAEERLKTLKAALFAFKNLDPKNAPALNQAARSLAALVQDITGLKLPLQLNIYNFFKESILEKFQTALQDFEQKSLRAEITITVAPQIKSASDNLLSMLEKIEKELSDYRIQIENKLDSWIAQLDDEYRRNMLKWTVVIGAAFVLIFNADSFGIYRFLSVDSQARNALMQKAVQATAKVQKSRAETLNEIDTAVRAGNFGKAEKLSNQFAVDVREDFLLYGDQKRADEAGRIKEEISRLGAETEDKKQALFKERLGDLSRMYVTLEKGAVAYQTDMLASLDLPLGWKDDRNAWKRLRANKVRGDALVFIARKLGGLMLTCFLITFGAPFWNDILSALVGVKNMALKKT